MLVMRSTVARGLCWIRRLLSIEVALKSCDFPNRRIVLRPAVADCG